MTKVTKALKAPKPRPVTLLSQSVQDALALWFETCQECSARDQSFKLRL